MNSLKANMFMLANSATYLYTTKIAISLIMRRLIPAKDLIGK
jgi:hypothetical protein